MSPALGQGGLGIRIIEIPIQVQDNPLSSIYFVNHLQTSSITSQKIEVSNSTNYSMNVVIYPGAATNLAGNFSAAVGATPNTLTSWVSISPQSQIIPPHSAIQALVTFKVPNNIESSQMYGVIWASTSGSLNANGVTNVNRVGIRMYITTGKSENVSSTSASKFNLVAGSQADTWALPLALLIAGTLLALLNRSNKKRAQKKKMELEDKEFYRFLSH